MADVTNSPMDPNTAGRRPDEDRSLVDLTIDPEEMLAARDRLRSGLLRHHYALLMLARIRRKRGQQESARGLEARAREVAVMIWCLDNPMESLTWSQGELK